VRQVGRHRREHALDARHFPTWIGTIHHRHDTQTRPFAPTVTQSARR
jgi:hypothetical protein